MERERTSTEVEGR